MKKQYHLFFSGIVQGVWFRGTARSLAEKHSVAGWVKNLTDGRVEIVAEADKHKLDSFLLDLKEKFKHNIAAVEKKENEYTGQYRGFEITF